MSVFNFQNISQSEGQQPLTDPPPVNILTFNPLPNSQKLATCLVKTTEIRPLFNTVL